MIQTDKALSKRPLVILAGPTAVGKTALSIGLAKEIGGEIISADSMQVYRYMDIGSAKITKEEMSGVRHFLIDVLDPWDEFNVVVFQRMCKQAMEEIYGRGKIPILVGGTGFYIQAILRDIDFTENDDDDSYRKELEELAETSGEETLHEMLKKIDPKAAEEIHPNNRKRVIRALEFYHQNGFRISDHNEEQKKKESPYNFCYFVLNDERSKVYERIDKRVDIMMQAGLLDEVKKLAAMGCNSGMVSMQGLGYKEILEYLDGNCTLQESVDRIKLSTRHFAKRQITWFKREEDTIWLNRSEYEKEEAILAAMKEALKRAAII